MARRRKIRKAHPRLFKYLTIFGATIGIASGTAFSAIMAIDAASGDLISDNVREYTASFVSEGSILSKATYKRGELIEQPMPPTHSIDGESNYFFIGWDTNKNGIPDFIPPNAYYDFEAEAVYFRTGKFDLDILDLLNMDLEDLLQLLEDLNIDWEQFMSMFNLDPETLMQLLGDRVVLTYETRPGNTEYPIYFRSTSYGDFDYGRKQFKNPDFYDSSLISDNSVNPLSYTAYKLQKLQDVGLLPDGFGFINFDITFAAVEDYYPVPDCESSNSSDEVINSDAHYVLNPVNNKYQTTAVYCPAFGYVIDLLDAIPLSGAVGRDEKKYYKYALEHYTAIPREYEQVIGEMISDNGWEPEETYQVDSIAAYVSTLGKCSMFNDDGTIDVNSYINGQKKSKDPVMDLITTGRGSDLDFNTTAVMLFRALNIPARLVKGYVGAGSSTSQVNAISLFNQHYWCEIYVKGTGWMICDCMDLSAVLGTNPYEEVDQANTPLEDKHVLERISVHQPDAEHREYTVGDEFDYSQGSFTAYYKDGKHEEFKFDDPGVTVTGFDSSEAGAYKITITYEYEGVEKSGSFYVTVKDEKKKLLFIDFDTTNAKNWYYEDEELDLSGIIATGHYDDGTTGDFTPAVTYSSGFTSKKGVYNPIVGVYNTDTAELAASQKQTSFFVEVFYKRVDEIVITKPITKDSYYEDDTFSLAGLEFEYLFYNGSTGPAFNYTIESPSATQMKKAGTYQVRISYTNDREKNTVEKIIPITVEANPPQSLTLTGYKSDYFVGQPFDAADFIKDASATVNYLHTGDNAVDVSKLDITTPDLSNTGPSYVTVTYTNGTNPPVSTNVPITVSATSGTITVKSYSIADETEFTYNGQSHNGITCNFDQPSNLPSFLHAEVDVNETGTPDLGTDVDEHHVQAAGVRIVDNFGNDYSYAYNYTIASGDTGVTYYINPRSVTITLSPMNSTYATNQNVGVKVSASGLASGDTASFYGSVSFKYVGTYSNYFKDGAYVRITHGGEDVTHCYDITYVYNSVVITD